MLRSAATTTKAALRQIYRRYSRLCSNFRQARRHTSRLEPGDHAVEVAGLDNAAACMPDAVDKQQGYGRQLQCLDDLRAMTTTAGYMNFSR
jgi:hypothetical protein